MKKSRHTRVRRNFQYPDQTKGSELAAKIRRDTNTLTERERTELFERGMQIIYGGSGTKEKIRPGQ